MASATRATGLTVGCIASSSDRPVPKRVDPGVVPNVSPISAGVAKPETVGMGRCSGLEHKHQLVLASIKRSHAAVGLVPDTYIFQFGE